MRLLLHQCCAPCSIYPLGRLLSERAFVHGYIYNPNIHPFTEYKKRTDAIIKYNKRVNIEYTLIDEYGLRPFIAMAATQDIRCNGCYDMRIEALAKYAADNDFTHISTTLLYSRRQKHDIIKAKSEELAEKYGVKFWYEDYRKGWQIGIDTSKQLGIYRQLYCGCIFSEEERYNKNN
jgi:predicted adenine nucleotide alpha hydrolase (AANH) superfamily ATPase